MKESRKDLILQTLLKLLETSNTTKITTALLARESGITEAALYRHFPSKRMIFQELFEFCDATIFDKINQIKKDQKLAMRDKLKNIFYFSVVFIEKNKGFSRILSREALSPDEKNVEEKVNQFFDRYELNIKQILQVDPKELILTPGIGAQILTTNLEGVIARFLRGSLKDLPSSYLDNYWEGLQVSIFK